MKFTNLAKTELASQLLISGNTFNVVAGKGAKFPAIGDTNLFMGIIWGAAFNAPIDDPDYEIVVGYRSATDQITVARAQEGTTAKQWEIGDNFMLTSTAGTFGRYETHELTAKTTVVDADEFRIWDSVTSLFKKINFANLKDTIRAYILPIVYPVGSVYINYSDSTNPGTLLGFGTWVATAVGRAIVGLDAGQTEFDTAGETGGAKTHTLTTTEIPSHNHNEKFRTPDGSTGSWTIQYNTNGAVIVTTENAGGGGAHNNLQPYQVFYIWRRTV